MKRKIWEMFPALCRAVNSTHNEYAKRLNVQMFHCHDFDHALRVANMAWVIAPDEKTGRLAAVAALCHNDDRLLQVETGVGPFGEVSRELRMKMIDGWLDAEPTGTFSASDRNTIIDAVMNHSKRNDQDGKDSLVLVTLKDADRLVNVEVDCIMRKAQYFGNSLRIVDPVNLLDDPKATFPKPGSAIRSLKLDLVDFQAEGGVASLRLPKAREIGKRRFAFWQLFLQEVVEQRQEMGLVPYPNFD